jgi:hypothetical protein
MYVYECINTYINTDMYMYIYTLVMFIMHVYKYILIGIWMFRAYQYHSQGEWNQRNNFTFKRD